MCQRRGRSTEHRFASGVDRQRDRLSGLNHGPPKQCIRRLARARRIGHARMLFDRIRFAGQRRLAGGAGRAFQDQRVSRHDIAGAHAQDIAGDHVLDVDLTKGAVTPDFRFQRHRSPQQVGRPNRMSFLHGIEPDRDRQDRHDDDAANIIAGHHRDNARGQQDQR